MTVGSQDQFYCRRLELQDKHFTIISAIKTPPGNVRHFADEMMKIHEEDQYATAESVCILHCSREKGCRKTDIDIPCEATVRKVMVQIS